MYSKIKKCLLIESCQGCNTHTKHEASGTTNISKEFFKSIIGQLYILVYIKLR